MRRHFRAPAALLLGALINGCAHDQPMPLPAQPPLQPSLQSLNTTGVSIAGPLSVSTIAVLAVNNSLDLAATRAQRGVSEAQMLQSRLLANPSITGSVLPLLAGPAAATPFGSATPAFNAGLTYDIRSLITIGSRRREARLNARSIDASLLWQEWQTIAQARLLSVDIIEGDLTLGLLRRTQALLQQRADTSRTALARGDATLATAAPDVTALQAARNATLDQERLQLGRRHQLNALLGLAPDVTLTLASQPDLPPINQAAIRRDLPTLSDRRPDLASLRYGYDAENAKLRTAILTQFPNLVLGITGGSDNSNIRNLGPQVSLDIPVFDHNQGGIALERATRSQLRAEYAARLATATGQVQASLAELTQTQQQIALLRHSLAPLKSDAEVARSAQASGDLDERTALDLILAPVTREQEIVALEQTVAEQEVAIATLTGAGLPPLHVQEGGS